MGFSLGFGWLVALNARGREGRLLGSILGAPGDLPGRFLEGFYLNSSQNVDSQFLTVILIFALILVQISSRLDFRDVSNVETSLQYKKMVNK